MERIVGKVKTAAARESHALKSVKRDELLKRKSTLYHKRQKTSKKFSLLLFYFGVIVYCECGEDRHE